ncbi:MAG: OmpA family protein [Bacteroidota bacterium]
MSKLLVTLNLMLLLAAPLALSFAQGDPSDCDGCKDPAIFTRMPGFHIYNVEDLEFNRYEFSVGADKIETVEGRYQHVVYYANDGLKLPSGLQIIRNYITAAASVGGKKIYEFEDGGLQYATLRLEKSNSEYWVHLQAGSNGMYNLTIVERQLMNQSVVANADQLAGSIAATGKAAVYGILFDTDKSVIKPESAQAITEIAKLLSAQPSLKLYVVGHTDNVGSFDHNITLSKSRAAAVVESLISLHGIAANRLMAYGDGPTAPVASNRDEEGRGKNRRVELVAQ